ncbi:protein translocase subunit SecD [Ferrimonas balearica]|uniref:protein translocase subunit SecD n=1 Tax=Ferrimonas balearica TaxID=44012 RepID=UPI001C589798|nr:protein translocase subunit SecD [Ferrimonas balearica]MBW3165052.1 protein translocase subunit SecD [Ferrimonas balearica]MBY5980081.1 protein translocase subunit SecD [Ferrimonas balearica]MBY6224580.1 protein translocase subunit SecD [Ferrimonas balearica]
MLNKYPMWKNLLVIFVIAIGALYAAPNLYGEDPALQISATRNVALDSATLDQVQTALQGEGLSAKSVIMEEGQILARFSNAEDQIEAKEVVAQALGGDYIVALNLAPATPEWLKSLGGNPMKLGLDLRGGVNFLMEVDMNEAVHKQQEQIVTDFRADLREQRLRYSGVRVVGDAVEVRFRDAAVAEQAYSYLRGRNANLVFSQPDDLVILATLSEPYLKEIKEYALNQNINILRNRVNELGVAEPVVQRQGAERITVELPGVQDTARAKEILGATATLEFRMVAQNVDLNAATRGLVPPGTRLYEDRDGRPVVLEQQVILTGDHITGAQSGFSETSQPQVNINLDAAGGNKMADFTRDKIGAAMATVFIEYKPTGERNADGSPQFDKIEEVINVATIQARLGRNFRITGIGSPAEAHNLALLLRAGALIAPITIVQERTIGPSLGQENINNGMAALMWGMLAVVVFMAIYYRKFGVIAVGALVVNLVMIVGIMSMIPGATLTLPGIAGIVLTVGMAVDGNVLIFERIREELKAGRSVQQAIHEGYSNALSTIADANITTLITALILFAVGTGPVKGFAVTLMIGIATSMFTSIVGSRAVVNALWGGKRLKKLDI